MLSPTNVSDYQFHLYTALSHLPWPRSYIGKIVFAAFAGTHVPLACAVIYMVLSQFPMAQALPILGVIFVATLVGTGLAVWTLYSLLAPVQKTTNALESYVDDRALPALPTDFNDRAGLLMRHTQRTLTHLDALLQFKSRMLGVVSHDARGSAHSILVAAEAIADQVDSGNPDIKLMRSLADHIETAVHYQLDITSSLLEVARYGEGKLTLDASEEPLEAVMDRVAKNMRTHALKRNHQFDVSINAPHDLVLNTDVQKLEQVLSNLVSNAIKYTPEGGRIGFQVAVNDERIDFKVSDTGPGIADGVLEDLFEAYERGDAEDEDDGSAGLGLWICRTFTDVLGGRLYPECTTEDGSTFVVSFDFDTLTTDRHEPTPETVSTPMLDGDALPSSSRVDL